MGYLLGITISAFRSRLASLFKEHKIDLSFEHFVLLHQLNAHKDMTQQELANHLQKDKSIILRQINILHEKQYVTRLTDKNDMRKKNLILTKKGFDILTTAKGLAMTLSDEVLNKVTKSDLLAFQRVLETIQINCGVDIGVCPDE